MRSLRFACVALLLATPIAAQIPLAEFEARRTALLDIVGDGVTLVLGGVAPAEEYFDWTQSRPFYYLTGFREQDAALVMVRSGKQTAGWIFVPPKSPTREVWTGTRLGADAARQALRIDGRSNAQLRAVLDSLLAGGARLNVVGDFGGGEIRTPHEQYINQLRAAHPDARVSDVTQAVASLRGVKSATEFERLRIAAGISARGHLAAMRMAVPGVAEFELEAAAEYTWRLEGADGPGYISIVGSGSNSTILHYGANSRVSEPGDVVVMDMAASFDGYTADITRTIPVNGRFSAPQRAVYEVVLAAIKSAERQVRVGANARSMSDSANAVLSRGLAQLGLIEAPGASFDCGDAQRPRRCSQLGLYYMHGLSHGIGLDVHDPEQYYESGVIGVGSAFTIEPGLYVRTNVLELIPPTTPANRALIEKLRPEVARYAGIGVRIEDDYLVTADGVERVSSEAPREIDEVEGVLALPRTPRVPGAAERFERMRTRP